MSIDLKILLLTQKWIKKSPEKPTVSKICENTTSMFNIAFADYVI